MKALLDLIARHRQGDAVGVTSICCAHPIVIEASLRHALQHGDALVLFEATCNQVNQDGGYTGMTPADFVKFVHGIAEHVGFDTARIVLGGDHLGPNPWTSLPAGCSHGQGRGDGRRLCRGRISQDPSRLLDVLRR